MKSDCRGSLLAQLSGWMLLDRLDRDNGMLGHNGIRGREVSSRTSEPLLQAIELYAMQRARLEKAQETLRPPLCGTMDSA